MPERPLPQNRSPVEYTLRNPESNGQDCKLWHGQTARVGTVLFKLLS